MSPYESDVVWHISLLYGTPRYLPGFWQLFRGGTKVAAQGRGFPDFCLFCWLHFQFHGPSIPNFFFSRLFFNGPKLLPSFFICFPFENGAFCQKCLGPRFRDKIFRAKGIRTFSDVAFAREKLPSGVAFLTYPRLEGFRFEKLPTTFGAKICLSFSTFL